ncbi:hypothetical protein R3W88_016505 [Solanum pinnatisectum]|uniref:RNase H type-1 domain-containing protein n=1 Tax=Solanum pinnatisectum TaxID=50273 RepID=A0AAV9L1S3_9SOLN|nr:hypothetical protein R3W88_016505 [Solanum pinnatisectum]
MEWSRLCTLIEKCSHDIKITIVQWTKPPIKWVKLNTDGSAILGSKGAEGVLRSNTRNMIFAFSASLGEGTNTQAEVEAAVFGLTWCVHLNYTNVILEVDSQLIVDYIKNNTTAPWNVASQLQQLHQLISHFTHFKCNHILREANYVADSMAKHH